MIRRWIKIMLLALLVLLQAACPKQVKQTDDATVHSPNESSNGTG